MPRAVANHVGNVSLCLAALAALAWALFTVFGQAVDRPLSDDHAEIHGDKPGTASLRVYIPENRHDDLYQIVRGTMALALPSGARRDLLGGTGRSRI